MMSLFADDAMLTDTAHDNEVYRGKDQVRTYWPTSAVHSVPSITGWLGLSALRLSEGQLADGCLTPHLGRHSSASR